MSKRARKGGEIGINGETYAGGTFLPSTRLPKQGSSARVRGVGRCLVEPGVFAVSPTGTPAIFGVIRALVVLSWNGDNVTLAPLHTDHAYWTSGGYAHAEVAALCARFNAGERWL